MTSECKLLINKPQTLFTTLFVWMSLTLREHVKVNLVVIWTNFNKVDYLLRLIKINSISSV